MKALVVSAPAKVNLGLFVGPPRADGRHELVTLFESVALADSLAITASPSGADEVLCEGVAGPNLVSEALAGLRAAGWTAPPLRVHIVKRIPVAAGMGGGSADAAALLRHAPALAPVAVAVLTGLAARLGADVPSQLQAGTSLGTGVGDILGPVPELPEHAVLVLPSPFGLATADVYREADRLGLTRSAAELQAVGDELRAWLTDPSGPPPPGLLVNDLQDAARSLRPEIDGPLHAVRESGAAQAMVCGSGPTVIGVYWGETALVHARATAGALTARHPGVVAVAPVRGGVAAPAANP